MAVISVGTFYIKTSAGKYIKRVAYYDTSSEVFSGDIITLSNSVITIEEGSVILNTCEGTNKYVFTALNTVPYVSVSKVLNATDCGYVSPPVINNISKIKYIGYTEPNYVKSFNIKDNTINGGKYLSLISSKAFYNSIKFNNGDSSTYELFGKGRDTLLLNSNGILTSIELVDNIVQVTQPLPVKDIYATITYENRTIPDDYSQNIYSDIYANFHDTPVLNDNNRITVDQILLNYRRTTRQDLTTLNVENRQIICSNNNKFLIESRAIIFQTQPGRFQNIDEYNIDYSGVSPFIPDNRFNPLTADPNFGKTATYIRETSPSIDKDFIYEILEGTGYLTV